MYHNVWRLFAKFYARLDRKPKLWNDRILLFVTYLVDACKLKSTTVRSYVSAIKGVLAEDGVEIENDSFELKALTRACRLKNDRVITRFPIYKDLLMLILRKLEIYLGGQPYLLNLYQALFSTAYFSLLRVGEVTDSEHSIRVKNTHIGTNKDKILLILDSSKTHNKGNKPQKIKISSIPATVRMKSGDCATFTVKGTKYCPFNLIKAYISCRLKAKSEMENFFVFSDGSLIKSENVRSMLKLMIEHLKLDSTFYNFHSLRIGHCGHLLKLGLSVETIKNLGRWKSNAVFTYLKN